LERQKTLQWLASFADEPEKKLELLLRSTIPSTGGWLLESPEFVEFTNGGEKARSLWCHGLPGAGKTYLS
jgi:hypothetical protein